MRGSWPEASETPGVEDASRQEHFWVAFFAVSLLLMPLLFRELYPFSSFHVFVDRPHHYSRYTVRDSKEQKLALTDFGLHRNYIGNGGYSVTQPEPHKGGSSLPPCLDLFGEVAHPVEVQQHVKGRLATGQIVKVTQEVIGPIDRRTVGVVAKNEWTIKADE